MKMKSFFVAARANLAAWALISEAAAARLPAPPMLLLLLLLSLSTPSTTSMRPAAISCVEIAVSCVEVAGEGDSMCRASRCAAVPVLLLLLLLLPQVLVMKALAVMGCAVAARLRHCGAWASWCQWQAGAPAR